MRSDFGDQDGVLLYKNEESSWMITLLVHLQKCINDVNIMRNSYVLQEFSISQDADNEKQIEEWIIILKYCE